MAKVGSPPRISALLLSRSKEAKPLLSTSHATSGAGSTGSGFGLTMIKKLSSPRQVFWPTTVTKISCRGLMVFWYAEGSAMRISLFWSSCDA